METTNNFMVVIGKIMDKLNAGLSAVDDFVWGPVMLILLVGTGIFLTVRTRFLPWRNLGYAIKSTLSKEARQKKGKGDVSPFSALTTALAATIGTGNIVGVATAMVSGGAGALVWMWISAVFGLSSKFSECLLSLRHREKNERGEMSGGPMYTMKNGLPWKKFGAVMGFLFALFAAIASFGIGNLTQSNSIASALDTTFTIPTWVTGLILTIFTLIIVIGGIQWISRVSSVFVPVMAIFYIISGLIVIVCNIQNVPAGVKEIVTLAFSAKAVAGGAAGTITAGMMQAMRYGIARGVFSNEAGMGSAAISAAAATTDEPVHQAYISMTGTFWDTIVVCTITGLCIASSGVLGTVDPATGELVQGAALTLEAFKQSILGDFGAVIVSIGIVLFAFSTILGWEYNGEKAVEYLFKSTKVNMAYRIIFSLMVFVGATTSLKIVWSFSDIANALMAIPNLVCMLLMSGEIAREIFKYQDVIKREKEAKKLAK